MGACYMWKAWLGHYTPGRRVGAIHSAYGDRGKKQVPKMGCKKIMSIQLGNILSFFHTRSFHGVISRDI